VAIEKKLPNIKGAAGHLEVITTPDATFRYSQKNRIACPDRNLILIILEHNLIG
jgi:hypothetical protein